MPSEESTERARRIKQLNREYTLFPWAVQSDVDPIPIDGGRGVRFWDATGKVYLDMVAQLISVNVGHNHPKIIEAMKGQLDRFCTAWPGAATEVRGVLARKIAEVTPGDLNHSFFALGGSDANDTGMKIARVVTGRQKFIARHRGYHGATFGSQSLSGDPRRWPFEPAVPGVVRAYDPYCYRCSFGKDPSDCGRECVEHIDELIRFEGPDLVAAVVVESVTGANGVIVPPPDYFPRLRAICDKYGVLLWDDEVMAGWGRTGAWFGIDNWGVVPDMMTIAKGLTGGHVPMSAIVVTDRVFNALADKMLNTGFTYGGNPVACAAGIAAVDIFKDERLIENSRDLGAVLASELAAIKEKHVSVGDVRSLGLFGAIELVRDRGTKEPINVTDPIFVEVIKRILANGVYIFGRNNNIMIGPPLCISRNELISGLAVVDEALEVADVSVNH